MLRLRAAHLEGRLETADLEHRIGRAHAARTREDLAALEADLPAQPGTPLTTTSGVPRVPGRRHFSERKLLHARLQEVREAALAFIVPPLERHGYTLDHEGPDVLVFNDARHGAGGRLTVRFRDAGDNRTLVLAHGVGPLAVRRAFARLSD